jgi:hypothetical protein
LTICKRAVAQSPLRSPHAKCLLPEIFVQVGLRKVGTFTWSLQAIAGARPWVLWDWMVQATLLIPSRRQANLLDRHRLRLRVQGIARMPVAQYFVALTIFFRSLHFSYNSNQ